MQFRNFSENVCLAVFLPSTSLKGKLSVGWLLWGFQHYLRVFHSCFSPLLVVHSRRWEVPAPSLTSICSLSQKIPFCFTLHLERRVTPHSVHPLSSFFGGKWAKLVTSICIAVLTGETFPLKLLGTRSPTANGALVSHVWRPPRKPELHR